ncbi:virulence factor family protein [Rhizobium oryzicola]|uniref:AcvB/VirJ family lysyl-phosphatidylglycerol hydrolase n=1 Tax=Rhizobium oryzicola TaxID=1232668 RepID=A0ABT8SSH5_9HYPH|nr:AcvB/VirJ family lysyl-phosphatidylglycerol hydrolase [Rhizobium oryzicola]MDO1580983.1 AcvB/VirJ family lysyl-phosphatidylglycerol hydrolase [Rhizobium oryzicola]
MKKLIAGLSILAGLAAQPAASQTATQSFDLGMLPQPHIVLPKGQMKANIFLLSDMNGWGAEEDKQARTLADKGAVVIGIDLPSYLAALNKDEGECVYMISDIESVAQQVQRSLGNGNYKTPIIAGIGEGGALVLGMASQTPPATIGEAVAIDPKAAVPLQKELCTPADKKTVPEGIIYGLSEGELPMPISIIQSKGADEESKRHSKELQAAHPDVDIESVDAEPVDALLKALSDAIVASAALEEPLGLPLTILDTKPKWDTIAIIYSGDGGWRDIDSEVGAVLQQDGVPVVGVDALRYFWSEKKPEQTSADLSRIIRAYRKQWNVSNVLLIGYSFGADILPATFNMLPETDRSKVIMMSLLGLSRQSNFEISVSGWLGGKGSGRGGDPTVQLEKVDPKIIQCVYGTEDEGQACTALQPRGVETLGIEGGHHFDEDYENLAKQILVALKKRLKK